MPSFSASWYTRCEDACHPMLSSRPLQASNGAKANRKQGITQRASSNRQVHSSQHSIDKHTAHSTSSKASEAQQATRGHFRIASTQRVMGADITKSTCHNMPHAAQQHAGYHKKTITTNDNDNDDSDDDDEEVDGNNSVNNTRNRRQDKTRRPRHEHFDRPRHNERTNERTIERRFNEFKKSDR